ncbi:MAG: hypothetical protein LBG58_00285 [Planctomycetaceae bacterium]|nr:hypothetical protein [Planctomycetaceae bacterium]
MKDTKTIDRKATDPKTTDRKTANLNDNKEFPTFHRHSFHSFLVRKVT